MLPNLIEVLKILTPAELQQLLNGTLGPLGGSLGNVTGGLTGGVIGGAPIAPPAAPGGIGLPRVSPNGSYQTPESLDPFNLATRGFDPGVGTMLLQGVAEFK